MKFFFICLFVIIVIIVVMYKLPPMSENMIGPMISPSSQCWQPILAIDVEPMIDQGLDDNCGPILACYIGRKIAPDDRPRITARVKPMIFQI